MALAIVLLLECRSNDEFEILSPKYFQKPVRDAIIRPVAIDPDFIARDRLTDQAVARLLSISRRTLLRWLKDGVVDPPAVVVGKQGRRCWAEHEVARIRAHMKRGDPGDSTRDFQSAGGRGEDHH